VTTASWARAQRLAAAAHRDLNCPRGTVVSALLTSTRPSSWANAAASAHPALARPGCRGASREQSREHRGSGSVRADAVRGPSVPWIATAGGAPQGASKARWFDLRRSASLVADLES
jgi:hypothetical protein